MDCSQVVRQVPVLRYSVLRELDGGTKRRQDARKGVLLEQGRLFIWVVRWFNSSHPAHVTEA
jgi:hypothetical protein